jgi:hypothetical protein
LCFVLHLESGHYGLSSTGVSFVFYFFSIYTRSFIKVLITNLCYTFLLCADNDHRHLLLAFAFRWISLFVFDCLLVKLGLILFDERGIHVQNFPLKGLLGQQVVLIVEILVQECVFVFWSLAQQILHNSSESSSLLYYHLDYAHAHEQCFLLVFCFCC